MPIVGVGRPGRPSRPPRPWASTARGTAGHGKMAEGLRLRVRSNNLDYEEEILLYPNGTPSNPGSDLPHDEDAGSAPVLLLQQRTTREDHRSHATRHRVGQRDGVRDECWRRAALAPADYDGELRTVLNNASSCRRPSTYPLTVHGTGGQRRARSSTSGNTCRSWSSPIEKPAAAGERVNILHQMTRRTACATSPGMIAEKTRKTSRSAYLPGTRATGRPRTTSTWRADPLHSYLGLGPDQLPRARPDGGGDGHRPPLRRPLRQDENPPASRSGGADRRRRHINARRGVVDWRDDRDPENGVLRCIGCRAGSPCANVTGGDARYLTRGSRMPRTFLALCLPLAAISLAAATPERAAAQEGGSGPSPTTMRRTRPRIGPHPGVRKKNVEENTGGRPLDLTLEGGAMGLKDADAPALHSDRDAPPRASSGRPSSAATRPTSANVYVFGLVERAGGAPRGAPPPWRRFSRRGIEERGIEVIGFMGLPIIEASLFCREPVRRPRGAVGGEAARRHPRAGRDLHRARRRRADRGAGTSSTRRSRPASSDWCALCRAAFAGSISLQGGSHRTRRRSASPPADTLTPSWSTGESWNALPRRSRGRR